MFFFVFFISIVYHYAAKHLIPANYDIIHFVFVESSPEHFLKFKSYFLIQSINRFLLINTIIVIK